VNKQVAREFNYNNLDKPFLDFLIAPSERAGEEYIYLFFNKNKKPVHARTRDLKKNQHYIPDEVDNDDTT
jgi:hypothetical protein